MRITPMTIEGAWTVHSPQHSDERGLFQEWFSERAFEEATGQRLHLAQANLAASRAGVVRGVHFAQVPPSQAKYVTCVSGAVLDVVVDLRVGSPTFGRHDTVLLDDVDRAGVYVSEGLGHAYVALADSVVTYLCSAPYAPGREHGVHPMCPELAIAWPTTGRDGLPLAPVLSDKDRSAPQLSQALELGILPTYDEALAFRASLRTAAAGAGS